MPPWGRTGPVNRPQGPCGSESADPTMAAGFTVALAGGPSRPGRAPAISTTATGPTDEALPVVECDEDARRVVRVVLAGDRDAFSLLVDREIGNVTRTCYRVLGNRDDAEDAAQEAFVSAYRTLPAWRGDGPFGAWMARIALNIALRRRRSARPVVWIDPASFDGPPDPLADGIDGGGQRRVARHFRDASVDAARATDPAEIAISAERAASVRDALMALDEPYRETVALRYFAGLTVPEIAEVCSRPQGTVKTHLHRGLLRLRGHLDATGTMR
jgi:RNA polymerase sigma-70 factor, ECF subfamily